MHNNFYLLNRKEKKALILKKQHLLQTSNVVFRGCYNFGINPNMNQNSVVSCIFKLTTVYQTNTISKIAIDKMYNAIIHSYVKLNDLEIEFKSNKVLHL